MILAAAVLQAEEGIGLVEEQIEDHRKHSSCALHPGSHFELDDSQEGIQEGIQEGTHMPQEVRNHSEPALLPFYHASSWTYLHRRTRSNHFHTPASSLIFPSCDALRPNHPSALFLSACHTFYHRLMARVLSCTTWTSSKACTDHHLRHLHQSIFSSSFGHPDVDRRPRLHSACSTCSFDAFDRLRPLIPRSRSPSIYWICAPVSPETERGRHASASGIGPYLVHSEISTCSDDHHALTAWTT